MMQHAVLPMPTAPTLALLVLQLSALAHELEAVSAAASHSYKYVAGALPKGDDLIAPQNLTLTQAKAKCSGLAGCAGISFKSGSATPAGVVHAYFKDGGTQSPTRSPGWQTYMRDDYRPNPMANGKQMVGPSNASDPAVLSAWHADMQRWREEYKNTSKYSGAIYSDPKLAWTQTSYMQPQMHPCE